MKRLLTLCIVLTTMSAVLWGQEATKKYGVKSGFAKAETTMMGQKIVSSSWFDEYGAKEVTKTEMNGMEITSLVRDGKTYAIVPSMKQIQEVPAQESINYMELTEAIMKKYKMQEVGKETLLGKECTTYSLEVNEMGQTAKMKVSIWQGYAMKAVTEAMGTTINVVVTEFNEGPVDASLFEVPKF